MTARKRPRASRNPEPGPSLAARGEAAAATYLQRAGYRVVARNLRTRFAEIDLLLRRRRLYVAVEVKTRRRQEAPERCVAETQLERLSEALARLAGGLRPRPRLLRVDLVAVRPDGADKWDILHLPGAAIPPPGA